MSTIWTVILLYVSFTHISCSHTLESSLVLQFSTLYPNCLLAITVSWSVNGLISADDTWPLSKVKDDVAADLLVWISCELSLCPPRSWSSVWSQAVGFWTLDPSADLRALYVPWVRKNERWHWHDWHEWNMQRSICSGLSFLSFLQWWGFKSINF